MMMHRARRGAFTWIASLAIAAALMGCGNKETWRAPSAPATSRTATLTSLPTGTERAQATPTAFALGQLIEGGLDLKAGPVDVPIELWIPVLRVQAPMLGVGLTAKNVMDAPKGEIGDPIWHTAYWFRGGGIPGDSGTATIAGHVNDPLGRPEIFANLKDLRPGDLIFIHLKSTNINIRFSVDRVQVYSTQESSDPKVMAQIFGEGPVEGNGPQPAPDGLAHLTLITCAGYIVDGEFDHHTVVFATRSK